MKEIEDRTLSLTRMPLTKATGFGIPKTELTIQILAKIIMAFVIIITTMETTSKRLMHNHPSMPRGLKPIMIGILEKTDC